MSDRKVIHYDMSKLGQLHCDAVGCGYVDAECRVWGPALIGTPCLRCSANLLTVEDYSKVQRMLRWIDLINKWFSPIFGTRLTDPGTTYETSVRVHGSGADISYRRLPTDGGAP